jgi:hypothetical protein
MIWRSGFNDGSTFDVAVNRLDKLTQPFGWDMVVVHLWEGIHCKMCMDWNRLFAMLQ